MTRRLGLALHLTLTRFHRNTVFPFAKQARTGNKLAISMAVVKMRSVSCESKRLNITSKNLLSIIHRLTIDLINGGQSSWPHARNNPWYYQRKIVHDDHDGIHPHLTKAEKLCQTSPEAGQVFSQNSLTSLADWWSHSFGHISASINTISNSSIHGGSQRSS